MCKTNVEDMSSQKQNGNSHMELDVFRKEFQEFLDYCNGCHFTGNDVQKMYENAMVTLNHHQPQENKKENANLLNKMKTIKNDIKSRPFLYLVVAMVTITIVTVAVWDWETVVNNASAIGRIAMIEMLPYYDWRPLKHQRCLIKSKSPQYDDNFDITNQQLDCNFCDAIDDDISTISMMAPDVSDAIKTYSDIDAPLLLTNVTLTLNDADALLTAIKDDVDYLQYEPCDVSSNVPMSKYPTAKGIFARIEKAPFFFVQWRNCHFQAVKLFRRHFVRPAFLDIADVSPIQFSWVLMSQGHSQEEGYRARNFKHVSLKERLGIVIQVEGRHQVTLKPAGGRCAMKCQDVTVDLVSGQALIVTDMWDIEYLPIGGHRTLAVILEAH